MDLNNLLYNSVYNAAPILLCVLGGIFAYKANVLNIALEGLMLAGAFVSVLVAYLTNNIFLGILAAIAACLVLGLIFSVMSVTYKGNVIVVGLAINMLVPAVADFVLKLMKSSNINLTWVNVNDFKIHIPFIEDIPILGSILSGHPPITYISFLMIIVMAVLMYRTKFGVYVRVVGENDDAARSLGLKSNRYKYIAILIGAFCCALAGINLSLDRLAVFTNNMTAGRGFIAIAAIYCGRGAPGPSAVYAIAFGVASALATELTVSAGSAATLLAVIPYVIMGVVLTVVSITKRRKIRVRGF